jgi:PAS domain S-box-containing protein
MPHATGGPQAGRRSEEEPYAEMLARTESKFRFALAVAELGAWDLDLRSQQAWRDERHDRIFGYASMLPEWTYEMFLDHVVPEDRERVAENFRMALETATEWDFTCRIRRADGEERWIEARGEPILDEAGTPVRLMGFVRDVTQARQAEAALREARDAAEKANRAKSAFLAMMSHELRTPLNAIGGYTELLEFGVYGPLTDEQRAALERIQYSQRHLLGLITDVLNYARSETGAIHYRIEDTEVAKLLAVAKAMVAPQVRAAELKLRVNRCPSGLVVRADADKLRQVLVNLIGNAIKFTDPGGRIDVACEEEPEHIVLLVRDTGIGIAADELETIFDPFVQVRQELTRTAPGVGLGLAISRDLARGMGGELTVESTPGEGSTFMLRLPKPTADMAAPG